MLQEYDKEGDLGDRLFHYVRKLLVNKQAYQIRLDIIAFIRDKKQEVEELSGIFLKKSQMTLCQYITEVTKKGGRCDQLGICIVSQMYIIHIELILWHGNIWNTHQTDDVSQVKLYVTFSNGWQYNLCESKPPPVIRTRKTKAVELPDLLQAPKSKKKGNC